MENDRETQNLGRLAGADNPSRERFFVGAPFAFRHIRHVEAAYNGGNPDES
jgi:hypothetical protein